MRLTGQAAQSEKELATPATVLRRIRATSRHLLAPDAQAEGTGVECRKTASGAESSDQNG
jgi:hypothetical protein